MFHSSLAKTYAQLPRPLIRGHEVYVYDDLGREYIDFYGGHAVSILGHTPWSVIDAITTQGETLFFYSNVAQMEIRERAAQELIEFGGSTFSEVFFCNSGAEANENALKVAIQLTGRQKLIAYKGSFHGRTLLASAVTDNPKWHKPFSTWMGAVDFITPNLLEELARVDSETAAVILEPIQSIAGVIEFESAYLSALRKRCDEVGAFLIFDEVQTGMGRTGVPFVSGLGEVRPEMATLAKGLASGFPVGALLLSGKVAQELKIGDLGSTFGGGPLAAAAISATIAKVREVLPNVREIENEIRDSISSLSLSSEIEVRGRGCLLGLKFASEAEWIMKRLFEEGIIVGTSGDKSVLRLLPPLIIEPKHVAILSERLFAILSGRN